MSPLSLSLPRHSLYLSNLCALLYLFLLGHSLSLMCSPLSIFLMSRRLYLSLICPPHNTLNLRQKQLINFLTRLHNWIAVERMKVISIGQNLITLLNKWMLRRSIMHSVNRQSFQMKTSYCNT